MITPAPTGRIILGATSFADAEGAIGFAVGLARQTERELVGLLIEEEAILSCAAGRGAQAVGAAPLSLERMLAAYRRDAEAFQARLAQSGALRWSFSRRRGQVLPLLSEIAGQGDLILLGHRRAPLRSGDVVFIPGGAADDAALGLAVQAARDIGRPITVLAPRALHAGIAAAAARLGAGAVSMRDAADPGAVMAHLGRASVSVVFLGQAGLDPATLARLVDAARAPVVFPAGVILPPGPADGGAHPPGF
ncbi:MULTISPECIES: hypothetical protein [Actibacterium]|uniref:Universal stress protein family protein n=1 Tax=Actibacterium naphthalenivorans TaxID=1614693 RepID=A0A840CNC1_9RHOB|nr:MULTISPECIES: hypothetical protein [Actibacterium]ALG91056.1 hypothetical protein TQ29_13800 [Actibacterium sp. EMB200-NS6]MBB4023457.1 hypothetical protein [Actibacterium naphthalenivorans]